MKGIKKDREQATTERQQFVRDLFARDCASRAKVGYVDPAMGATKAQKEFKKRFGVGMNSQGLYRIRAEVFHQYGLDNKGRPAMLPDRGDGQALAVAVIPVDSEDQGRFLQRALTELRTRGLVDENVAVDGVFKNYATVSKIQQ